MNRLTLGLLVSSFSASVAWSALADTNNGDGFVMGDVSRVSLDSLSINAHFYGQSGYDYSLGMDLGASASFEYNYTLSSNQTVALSSQVEAGTSAGLMLVSGASLDVWFQSFFSSTVSVSVLGSEDVSFSATSSTFVGPTGYVVYSRSCSLSGEADYQNLWGVGFLEYNGSTGVECLW